MKPRFRKNADGTFVRITDEELHVAEVHIKKARNHEVAAKQLLGEEPVKTAAPKPTPPTPTRDESLVNLPGAARICGLTEGQLRKLWENDPAFPGPLPYKQLWRRWQIDDYNRRLNP
jgi:hypothetical protein